MELSATERVPATAAFCRTSIFLLKMESFATLRAPYIPTFCNISALPFNNKLFDTFNEPLTSNSYKGFSVPIPTFPVV